MVWHKNGADMKSPVKIALVLSALITLWVLSGLVFPSGEAEQGGEDAREKDVSSLLEVTPMEATPRRRYVVLYGETAPLRSVALKAETQGTVVGIPAEEGQALKKGDVILKIDERDRQARLTQAEALVRQREIEYKAAVRLQEKGFQTDVRLAEAKTRLEDAKAALKTTRLDLEYTQLRAPFDCFLQDVQVEIGDFVGVGVFGGEGAIATVVDMDPIKVTGEMAQFDLPFLDRDNNAFITLSDGQRHEGKITYVSSVADATTRTFRIEVEIPNKEHKIPAGVAAELHVPLDAVPSYLVNSSSLSLADDGKVGIKTLDADGTVHFTSVTVVEETREGVWITGLPQQARIITLGQVYVNAGQKVDPGKVAVKGKDGAEGE